MASSLRHRRVQTVMRSVLRELQADPEASTGVGRARIALAQTYMQMEVAGNIVKLYYEAMREDHGQAGALRATMRWYYETIVDKGGFRWLERTGATGTKE